MESRHCDCTDWKENIDKVNNPILFFHSRFNNPYSGKVFEYCPWCGQELAECSEADYDEESATRKDER